MVVDLPLVIQTKGKFCASSDGTTYGNALAQTQKSLDVLSNYADKYECW